MEPRSPETRWAGAFIVSYGASTTYTLFLIILFSFLFFKNSETNAPSCYGVTASKTLCLYKEFEQNSIKYLWRTHSVSPRPFSPASTFSAIDQQLGITPSVTSRVSIQTSANVQIPTNLSCCPNAIGGVGNFTLLLQPQMRNLLSDPEKGGKQTERNLVMIGPIYAGCGAAMAACAYKFHLFIYLFLLVLQLPGSVSLPVSLNRDLSKLEVRCHSSYSNSTAHAILVLQCSFDL